MPSVKRTPGSLSRSVATPSAIDRVRELTVSEDYAPEDRAGRTPESRRYNRHLGAVTLVNLFNILNIRAGYLAKDLPVLSILDYGCGYGRVTRWLRVGFPNARILVADRYKAARDWCMEKYDCRPCPREVPADRFDLVWVGSAFAGLREEVAGPLLDSLLLSLKPRGVLAFASNGRARIERMRDFEWDKNARPDLHFGLPRESFEKLVAGYDECGYGFVENPLTPQRGVALVAGAWYAERVYGSKDFTQILFQEKADGSQDLSAFMRMEVGVNATGPLWSPSDSEASRTESGTPLAADA